MAFCKINMVKCYIYGIIYEKAREDCILEHIWVTPLRHAEPSVCQYGMEDCDAHHSFGPAVRDHFLLHFVTSGRGVFVSGGKEYTVGEGEGFLIFPGEVAYYEADEKKPWCYSWIGFSGGAKLMEELGLSVFNPVFSFADTEALSHVFAAMERADETRADGQLRLVGNLFMLLAEILPQSTPARSQASLGAREDYVEHAIRYIQQNYALKLTVGGIAEHLGIHRSYFSAIFKEHTHTSPQAFLLWVRMSKAKELLSDGRLSILSIAHSVGYEDALLFSRTFKKQTGLSPREYRKEHEKKT